MANGLDQLLDALKLATPLIGVYDAPDPDVFAPLVLPSSGHFCVFAAWDNWLAGQMLHLTADRPGCGGCASWWFGEMSRSRDEYIDFLYGREGLKASRELMGAWVDHSVPYQPRNGHILVGPLKPGREDHLRSITFFVNPDQLALLSLAAHYHHDVAEVPPVTAPFGSGCMQMLSLLGDPLNPRAVIGGLDIAMRGHLPPDILAFTVNPAMLERFDRLDADSFLTKPFWRDLRKARGN